MGCPQSAFWALHGCKTAADKVKERWRWACLFWHLLLGKRGPAWSLTASALAAARTPGAREGSRRVPVPQGGDAWPQAPESLWASRIIRVRADNARRAADRRVAAAAQAVGTCENFVKGDERKREAGEAGGCEHLARQPRQLPPSDGILSSGHPLGAVSHSIPFVSPQLWRVELGQRWRWERVAAVFSLLPQRKHAWSRARL